MEDFNQRISLLEIRLAKLREQELLFRQEINALQVELSQLKQQNRVVTTQQENVVVSEVKEPEVIVVDEFVKKAKPKHLKPKKVKEPINWEAFVGGNLINKIGVLVIIIGVAIGAKLSIDQGLISEGARIGLGYLVGFALMGAGFWLKKKYHNYSAVMVSGAMGINYVITFIAYDVYELLPQELAFGLMLIFTAFTITSSLIYNRQIIAHIGLVGGYAVPFLLSNGSGKVEVLLVYMLLLNLGVLILSFKKYWKPLYFMSFSVSWIIVIASFLMTSFSVNHDKDVTFLVFAGLFYLLFYATGLSYKLLKNEKFVPSDVVLIVLNGFLFFMMGAVIIEDLSTDVNYLGTFALFNALVNFMVTMVIYKKKLADRKLFYLTAALVLSFLTITVPLQLDGEAVTLIWIAESLLLFYFGVKKKIKGYQRLSFPVMIAAFVSLMHDWGERNVYSDDFTAFLNVHFLTVVLFVAAFVVISKLLNAVLREDKNELGVMHSIMNFVVPGGLIFVAYAMVSSEIYLFFNTFYQASEIQIQHEWLSSLRDRNFRVLRDMAPLSFTILLTTVSTLVLRKREITTVRLVFVFLQNAAMLLTALGLGLALSRDFYSAYVDAEQIEYFGQSLMMLNYRYLHYALVMGLLFAMRYFGRVHLDKTSFDKVIQLIIHGVALILVSFEMVYIGDVFELPTSHKLILSLVFSVYAGSLIGSGIAKKLKHLRIAGIILFGITIFKLFIIDIADMTSIAKTIAYVILGVILLLISFFYNKYKNVLFGGNDHEK